MSAILKGITSNKTNTKFVPKSKYVRKGQALGKRRYAAPSDDMNSLAFLGHSNPTRITKLANNIRVATENIPGETASIAININAGSAHEGVATSGTAHFLEHMAFKGTGTRSQSQIELEVENMGAHLNAFTTREQTVFIANAFKKDISSVLTILADIIQNSQLDKSHIERERGVILSEKKMVESNIEEVVTDYLHAAAFQNHGLGRSILGSTDNIRSISREDLLKHIQSYWVGDRIVISAAGDVDHDALCALATKLFSGLAVTGPADVLAFDRDMPEYFGAEIRHRDDTVDTLHGAIAFQGAPWSSTQSVHFAVAQSYVDSFNVKSGVDGNSDSRLAERSGVEALCHNFSAFSTNYNATGLFGVNFECDADRADHMAAAILDNLTGMDNIRGAELIRAQNRVKVGYLMNLNNTNAICEEIGRQVLNLGRRVSPAEYFARVDATTPDDLKTLTNTFIRDQDQVVALHGPTQYFPDYNWVRQWTGKL